jgi:hypothetical protein
MPPAGGTRTTPRALHAGIAALGSLLLACTGELTGPAPAETRSGDAGDPHAAPGDAGGRTDAMPGPFDAATPTDASAAGLLFAAEIDPLLDAARPRGACTSCHEGGDPSDGPDFLGPDAAGHRAALLAQPRIVGDRPETSLLFTRGDHAGDAWCTGPDAPYAGCDRDEAAAVADWITAEASQR